MIRLFKLAIYAVLGYVLFEFFLIKLGVARESDVLYLLAVALFHPVKNNDSVRPRIRFGFHLDIKETFFAITL
jgi:hypothetical protein